MNQTLWLRRIRNLAGFLGMILPWISLLGAYIYSGYNPVTENFWKYFSISETYYVTPALAGILTAASIVLMCYDGYTLQDNLVTTLSGAFGLMIVLFPCDCSPAPDVVGFFQIPADISNTIHCVATSIFFILLAYNSLFLFTIGDTENHSKKMRNIVYKICGIGMVVSMILMVIPFHFYMKTFWIEAVALTFFGISWLVKGNPFNLFGDD